MKYNLSVPVEYTDNTSYRQCLRQVFEMNPPTPDFDKMDADIDSETIDELLFDSNAVKDGLDDLLIYTKDIPEFMELYMLAAAHFLSESPELGIGVLMSYDTFQRFHYCLVSYFENPNQNKDEFQIHAEKIREFFRRR